MLGNKEEAWKRKKNRSIKNYEEKNITRKRKWKRGIGVKEKETKKTAVCVDRTHDLQIYE